MKNLLYAFVLIAISSTLFPSCAENGEFEEIVLESQLDYAESTDDREEVGGKPGER